MRDTLILILSFGFALGVIILVHEAGHLLMAKLFRMRVLTFSVGFGTSLFSVRRGGTEYRLSAIPLGGYVRLGGENPEESTGDPWEFLHRPRWQRVLVYLAGPAMNVLLAIALFAGLFMVGIEAVGSDDMAPIIGAVEPGSSAAAAGLQKEDRILSANGAPTPSFQQVGLVLTTSPDRPVTLAVQRGKQTLTVAVTPRRIPRYDYGDFAGILPLARPHLRQLVAGSPAQLGGLRVGDEIRAVNGKPIANQDDFIKAIQPQAGRRVEIGVMRQGRLLSLFVVPRAEGPPGKQVGKIGVVVDNGYYRQYPPGQAILASISYNLQIVRETFQILGKIFRREISAKGALAGPIEMAVQARDAALIGFKYLLHLMGFISISIALLNLMPIPILDGGQISILLVESIIRHDIPPRAKEFINQVGFVFILALMAVVIVFDLMKHVPASWLPGS